jgi:ribonuclease P protein component
MSFHFPKKEHLCSKKDISRLFEAGTAFIEYPLRAVFLLENFSAVPLQANVQMMVSVPKKRHKRANVRNRLKRLIRESYRLNNAELKTFIIAQNQHLLLAFQYISDNKFDYATIENATKNILEKTKKLVAENEKNNQENKKNNP